ncbi:MAG: hypothetical protein FJW39_22905 [Acidobacteria bacterium]|nr:hypothetical protein [Acidobacteriota bacterium]
MARPNFEQTVPAKLLDVHEDGCGIKADQELAAGTLVRLTGDLKATGKDVLLDGKVVHSRPGKGKFFVIGVEYCRPAAQKPGASSQRPAEPARERMPEDKPDYYEILQLSSNADAETVQRVYRILAQRYHPDNTSTGNSEMFRRVLDAYQVLSDPERRAAYDVDYRMAKKLQWRIFDQPTASLGVEGERAKRKGVLSLLYTKRRNTPEQPALGLIEMEDLLGVPRDHMEFTLWFLKEAGLILRTDSSKYAITYKGVEHAEQDGSWQSPSERLIESHDAIERREAAAR